MSRECGYRYHVHFFPVFHQLDTEGKTEHQTDKRVKPDFDAAWLYILSCVGFPDIVMTHLIIGNLKKYAAIFNAAYSGREIFIDIVLGYFIFLKNRDMSGLNIPSLFHKFLS